MAIILSPYGGGTLIGSVGSVTFQRNPFGNLARQRVKPVDPNTLRQQAIKLFMSQVSAEWKSLTAAFVAEWNSYALNTPIQGPKGTQITLSGRSMYMRSRMFQKNGGWGPEESAPSLPGVPPIPSPLISYALTGAVTLNAQTDFVAAGALRFLISRNLHATRNYWKGPFEITANMDATETLPFVLGTVSPPPAAGDKVFIKFKQWDEVQNTVSGSAIISAIAA